MKYLFFSLLFTSSIIASTAQTNEFAPVGAKWWYSSYSLVTDYEFPQTFESVAEIMVDGKVCKKILTEPLFIDSVIIYQNEDTIFRYFPAIDKFKVLINFNVEAGDSYYIFGEKPGGIDSAFIHVVSTEMININGYDLKKQTIETDGSFGWGEVNIEKIGNSKFFLPIYSIFEIDPSPLRCYEDDSVGLYETGVVSDCDEIIYDEITEGLTSGIFIYPNPTSNNIYIEIANALEGSTYITDLYDIRGKLIYSKELNTKNTNIFDLGTLNSGIYLMRTYENGVLRSAEKITKI